MNLQFSPWKLQSGAQKFIDQFMETIIYVMEIKTYERSTYVIKSEGFKLQLYILQKMVRFRGSWWEKAWNDSKAKQNLKKNANFVSRKIKYFLLGLEGQQEKRQVIVINSTRVMN